MRTVVIIYLGCGYEDCSYNLDCDHEDCSYNLG